LAAPAAQFGQRQCAAQAGGCSEHLPTFIYLFSIANVQDLGKRISRYFRLPEKHAFSAAKTRIFPSFSFPL
jgi:hypothetical protein